MASSATCFKNRYKNTERTWWYGTHLNCEWSWRRNTGVDYTWTTTLPLGVYPQVYPSIPNADPSGSTMLGQREYGSRDIWRPKFVKILHVNKIYIAYDQNYNSTFYPRPPHEGRPSYRGNQSIGKAFSPQKRTTNTSKHQTSSLFSFCGLDSPPRSGSSTPKLMRIRIHNTNSKSLRIRIRLGKVKSYNWTWFGPRMNIETPNSDSKKPKLPDPTVSGTNGIRI